MNGKKIILGVLSFLITHFAIAQGFQFGVKAGADLDKISGKSFKDEFAYGYHLGGYAVISLSKKVAIQPELYYSSVNMRRDTAISTIYSSIDPSNIKLGYLNIPILLNIKAGEKLSLLVGPKFGIVSDGNLSLKTNAERAIKSGDLAMVAGLQLNFSGISVYGRYNVGVLNINEITNQEKWTRQTIHVGVALKII